MKIFNINFPAQGCVCNTRHTIETPKADWERNACWSFQCSKAAAAVRSNCQRPMLYVSKYRNIIYSIIMKYSQRWTAAGQVPHLIDSHSHVAKIQKFKKIQNLDRPSSPGSHDGGDVQHKMKHVTVLMVYATCTRCTNEIDRFCVITCDDVKLENVDRNGPCVVLLIGGLVGKACMHASLPEPAGTQASLVMRCALKRILGYIRVSCNKNECDCRCVS